MSPIANGSLGEQGVLPVWGHGFTWESGLPISRNPRRPCLCPDTLFLMPELAKTQPCSHPGLEPALWLPGMGMGTGMGPGHPPGRAGVAPRCWAGRRGAPAPGVHLALGKAEPLCISHV